MEFAFAGAYHEKPRAYPDNLAGPLRKHYDYGMRAVFSVLVPWLLSMGLEGRPEMPAQANPASEPRAPNSALLPCLFLGEGLPLK